MPLATIQKIESVESIPNSDNIEKVKILGWEVVVAKKDNFKTGDLCIYLEIDCLVPNKDWSKFLFKAGHEEDEYYRLRTIKLRGQISQGLVLPINIHNGDCYVISSGEYESYSDIVYIGEDVTDLLGIKKYEKPQPLGYNTLLGRGRRIPREFPSFLHKTDEVRIQSAPQLLDQLKGKPYYVTMKMDGTSATYYKYKGKFGVCSRNLELYNPLTPKGFWDRIYLKIRQLLGRAKKEIPDLNIWWSIARKYDLENILPEGYCIQGEICGPGIQGNKMGLKENELFVFNIWNIKEDRKLSFWEMNSDSGFGSMFDFINPVPLLEGDVHHTKEFNYNLEQLLELANNTNYPNDAPAEGIVVRSLDQSISFKVVSNKFLLKYGE